ncbi:MAG: hypothetical protein NTV86_12780 [Planctomycetota bacterium]|nr:hypothetical protein [Planctomycetota bacterium]
MTRITHIGLVVVMVAALSCLNGCSQRAGYIESAYQSPDGRTLLFVGDMGPMVWVLGEFGLIPCGERPCAVSASGRTVAATDPASRDTVKIIDTRSGGKDRTAVVLPKDIPAQCELQLRTDDQTVLLKASSYGTMASNERFWSLSLVNRAWSAAGRAQWDAMADFEQIEPKCITSSLGQVKEFPSKAGIVVRSVVQPGYLPSYSWASWPDGRQETLFVENPEHLTVGRHLP